MSLSLFLSVTCLHELLLLSPNGNTHASPLLIEMLKIFNVDNKCTATRHNRVTSNGVTRHSGTHSIMPCGCTVVVHYECMYHFPFANYQT
jgi:hypothetical protein